MPAHDSPSTRPPPTAHGPTTTDARPRSLPLGQAPFVSLGVKLTVPAVALILLAAVGVYFALVHQARTMLLRSKAAAAEMVVDLTSASVMPAVVFDDATEMERAVGDLARNPDVTDVELWAVQGTDEPPPDKPLAEFHRQTTARLGRPATHDKDLVATLENVLVTRPVIDPGGKTVALVVVRFSTAAESAALAGLARQALGLAAALAVALALGLGLAIARVAVAPLRRLQASARRIAEGAASPSRLRRRRRQPADHRMPRAGCSQAALARPDTPSRRGALRRCSRPA